MAAGVGVTVWCIVVSLRARKAPNSPTDRWGRPAGSGCKCWPFHVLLVLLSQPGHPALVPLWIMLGRWGRGTQQGFSTSLYRLLVACLLSKLCHAVVELVVLHRTLGGLSHYLRSLETYGLALHHLC
jgi:hypothetical protein